MESTNRIVVSELDTKFKDEVANTPGGERIKRCFQCGSCSAGCPVHELSDRYNPRKVIRMILLGMRDKVISSDFVWLCACCYTCRERCPQDVRISDIMVAVRNIAVKSGYTHPAFLQQLELIRNQGKLYEIDEFDNKRRERLGLPHLPPRNEDTGKVLAACEVSKLLEG
ncbi:4Fe-4S dicluster domain-containing protein [Candidatus Poribacteria bacterium]